MDVKVRQLNILSVSRLVLMLILCCFTTVVCRSTSGKGDVENIRPDRGTAFPKKEEKNTTPVIAFENSSLTPSTNIHYTGEYCNECHSQVPVEGGPRYLKFGGDYGVLCRCHAISPNVYIHPFNMEPSALKKEKMPPDFPLEKGKVTCLTCHDIYKQCQKSLFERTSLRGAPYPKRSDFCYNCHAADHYEQVDPHIQINPQGDIVIETCLICHKEKPDESHATFKEVTFIGDIEAMCRRCHHIAGNHSGNADHMGIVPSPDGLRRIKNMEKKHHARLPLDENGKMTCITCHNPHAKGVIPETSPGARGAGSKYRHRIPKDMCKDCHEM